jgi:hypothetical protein
LTRGSINSGAVAMPVNGSTARRPGWSPNGSTTTSAERRTWTSVWSARCYNRQRGETEQELAELLAGEPGADVEAAVNAVLLANGQPARPHTAGSISTPEDQGCRCPPTSTGRPCPDRFQVLIELARRRRERLQGRPHVGYDPLFNGAVVQPGAKRDGADGITLGELIEQVQRRQDRATQPRQVTEYHALLRLLRDAWDEHVPVRSITREHCRKIRDLVAVSPKALIPA